jgi:starch synthase (maltosyl-transferring)
MASVNAIRRDQLALHTLRTLRFHGSTNDQVLAYSKTAHGGPAPDPSRPAEAPVLVVANLDPHGPQAAVLRLDLGALGVDATRPYVAEDLLGGETYVWHGSEPYVELHPDRQPGHVLRIVQDDAPAAGPAPTWETPGQ